MVFHRVKQATWRCFGTITFGSFPVCSVYDRLCRRLPSNRYVVALYAFNLFWQARFSLMWHYALVQNNLSEDGMSLEERKSENACKPVYGLVLYATAVIVALIYASSFVDAPPFCVGLFSHEFKTADLPIKE